MKKELVLSVIMLLLAVTAVVARVQPPDTLVSLTPAERTWRDNHKAIRVGISPVFPPLKFSDHGVIKGIEPDYLNLLSEYTGLQFEYVIADFPSMDAKVQSGEMDMFISFQIPERLAYMTFTEPLMEFRQVIVARNDAPFVSGISALKGKKIATVKGVKLYEKILAPYPDIHMVPVDTMEQMFRVVAEAKADALISKTIYAGYLINNYPNLKIAGIADLPPEPYLYAVRKDYPELVSILNKAIQSIPTDKRDAIIQKWFSVRVEYRPNWFGFLKWAALIGGAFTVVLGVVLFSNRRLVKEIEKNKRTEESLRESEQQLSVIFETSEAGIILVSPGGIIDFANRRMAEMFRLSLPELIGTRYADHLHESEKLIGSERMGQLIQGEIQSVSLDRHYSCADGTDFWGHLSGRRLDNADGSLRALVGVISDITERKLAEEVLTFLATAGIRDQDEPFFNALARYLAQSLAMDFVCIDYLEGDGLTARTVAVWSDGQFEDNVSYALKDTPCGDVVGKTVCCFPAGVCRLFPDDQVLQDLRADSYVGVTLWSHTGKPIGLIAVIGRKPLENRQLAEAVLKLVAVRAAGELERQEAEAELLKISLTDELTGLNNRRGFMLLAKQQFKVANRMGTALSLIFLDIDRMKWINDTYGHAMGDLALIETAGILRKSFRAADIIARIGGDEFVVLSVDQVGMTDNIIHERLRENLHAYNLESERPFPLSVSYGLTTYDPDSPCSIEELLERGDQEMYKQKTKNP